MSGTNVGSHARLPVPASPSSGQSILNIEHIPRTLEARQVSLTSDICSPLDGIAGERDCILRN
ncbi:hypothetical protein SAY86_008956 [Trapa natans]|uniref:Uncharacterized protein n=1 Tax=Trapa natans TaxID=22666 RepID=A0AAN7QBY6_TRANT|nr:hypothetical protein SAY86_008956 [Trapa natans]